MDETRIIRYLDGLCAEADREASPESVNGLPGMVKHYYVNVFKARLLTSESWLRDYPGAAAAAWRNLTEADDSEAQRRTLNETRAGQTRLAAELAALKESLADQVAELEQELGQLRQENDRLKGKRGAKKTPPDEQQQTGDQAVNAPDSSSGQ
jgi:cell shape-determining protein MreC